MGIATEASAALVPATDKITVVLDLTMDIVRVGGTGHRNLHNQTVIIQHQDR